MPIITVKAIDLPVVELARLLQAELAPSQAEDKIDRFLSLAERVCNDQATIDSAGE